MIVSTTPHTRALTPHDEEEGEMYNEDASAAEEESDYEEEVTALYSISQDTYGCLLKDMLRTADMISRGDLHKLKKVHHIFELVVTAVLWFAAMFFQLSLTFFVFASTIEWKEDMYEPLSELSDKKAMLDSATTKLPDDDATLKLCRMNQVPHIEIYVYVVGIWFSKMIQELMDTLHFARVIVEMRDRSGKPLIENEKSANGKIHKVVGLTLIWRVLSLVLVCIPKIVIALWVSFVGAKLLIFADTSGNLILKALTCLYFVTIDDVLHASFTGRDKKETINQMKLEYVNVEPEWWSRWGNIIFRLGSVILGVYLVIFVAFGPVFDLRYACQDYFKKFPEPQSDNHGLKWFIFG